MKYLIIHPEDPTTTFLSPIYAKLTNKTVIRGCIPKSEMLKLIESHDRVLMLGHGSPNGLRSIDMFPDAGSYIIDDSMALTLKNKRDNVYIWCHASQFVQRHELSGLYCGMFLSEMIELLCYGFDDLDSDWIDQSNERFATVVSEYINEPLEILYMKLMIEYGYLARTNPIAEFNLNRLYLAFPGNKSFINPIKVKSVPY